MRQDLLVSGSGRGGGRCRCNRLSAVEGVEGRMGMIDVISYPVGAVLRIGRRRRVRGRGGMHGGRHDVVQFGIAADKDGGGCTRVAHYFATQIFSIYPQIKHHEEVHNLRTYQGFQDLAVMLKYAAIQFKRA